MTKPTAIKKSGLTDDKATMSRQDTVDTSDLSHFISTNIPEAKSSLAPRTDMISHYSAVVNEPANISEVSVDAIFSRMLSA